MFVSALKKSFTPMLARGFSKIVHMAGQPKYHNDTKNVALRGTYIEGNFKDLPNLIFFPEMCDPVVNWTKFFADPDNQILNQRNVWLLNPRNFGNSDRHESFDLNDMADDVIRFMYENKISTATLAGHGFGGKLALAVGCYHAERVTGVVSIDSAPLDQRYHEAFREFREYIDFCSHLDLSMSRPDVEHLLKKHIADPKWRAIFTQNIKRVQDKLQWDFEMNYLARNILFNKSDSLGAWSEKHGLYTGRVRFIFPEYSRWVHMNTNTLPMLKVAVRCGGFGRDIFALQGDENPLNHWMYEFDEQSFALSRKMNQFFKLYDGVHVLLQDRTEVGNYFVPDRFGTRNDSNHLYGSYSPAHLHHNWRFNNIYENSKKFDEPSQSQPAPQPEKKGK